MKKSCKNCYYNYEMEEHHVGFKKIKRSDNVACFKKCTICRKVCRFWERRKNEKYR